MQNVTITLFDKEGAILQYKEHIRRAERPKEATKNGRAIESLVNALKRLKKNGFRLFIRTHYERVGPKVGGFRLEKRKGEGGGKH